MAAQNLARAVYGHEEAYASTDAFLEAYSRGDAAACGALYTKDATVLPGDRPVGCSTNVPMISIGSKRNRRYV